MNQWVTSGLQTPCRKQQAGHLSISPTNVVGENVGSDQLHLLKGHSKLEFLTAFLRQRATKEGAKKCLASTP
jgi:hypothetical protein